MTRPNYTEVCNRLRELKSIIQQIKDEPSSLAESAEGIIITLHEISQIEKILEEVDEREKRRLGRL